MAKFLRLVHNEYIKAVKKVSTKILFIIIALSVLGLMGIAKISEYQNNQSKNEFLNSLKERDYSEEISSVLEMKNTGYEFMVEKYQFQSDNNIERLSWKESACDTIFDFEIDYDDSGNETAEYRYSEQQREEMKKYVLNDDWKSFCKAVLEILKSSEYSEDAYIWEYEYRINHDIPLPKNFEESINWQNTLLNDITELKRQGAVLESEKTDTNKGDESLNAALEAKYYQLENNIETNVADHTSLMGSEVDFWTVFYASNSLIKLVGALIIIIAGSTIASEFSNGTIKFLLINPVKRWKILVSKYTMCISLGYIMLIFLYIVSALLCIIFFGTDTLDAQHITFLNGEIVEINGFLFIAKSYLLSSVNVVVMATLAFAVSSLVRSSALAIGVSLFSLLSGSLIVDILKEGFNLDWARYFIFANTDLAAISNNQTIFSNQTVSFALTVIAAHMAVFILAAWDGFTKREV